MYKGSFSSPEAALLLVSTKNRDLWPPFGQHQESRPLARSNDIPVLNGFVNTIDWDQSQSDLSDDSEHAQVDGKSVNRGLPVLDPEVAILVADQKERGLWEREWQVQNARAQLLFSSLSLLFRDALVTVAVVVC